MMTGRLPPRMGIGWIGAQSNGLFTSESKGGIPDNETTIAEVLGENGYYTAAVGKVENHKMYALQNSSINNRNLKISVALGAARAIPTHLPR